MWVRFKEIPSYLHAIDKREKQKGAVLTKSFSVIYFADIYTSVVLLGMFSFSETEFYSYLWQQCILHTFFVQITVSTHISQDLRCCNSAFDVVLSIK